MKQKLRNDDILEFYLEHFMSNLEEFFIKKKIPIAVLPGERESNLHPKVRMRPAVISHLSVATSSADSPAAAAHAPCEAASSQGKMEPRFRESPVVRTNLTSQSRRRRRKKIIPRLIPTTDIRK